MITALFILLLLFLAWQLCLVIEALHAIKRELSSIDKLLYRAEKREIYKK